MNQTFSVRWVLSMCKAACHTLHIQAEKAGPWEVTSHITAAGVSQQWGEETCPVIDTLVSELLPWRGDSAVCKGKCVMFPEKDVVLGACGQEHWVFLSTPCFQKSLERPRWLWESWLEEDSTVSSLALLVGEGRANRQQQLLLCEWKSLI